MKKSRNLDRDGLDGILPPADKANIDSRQAKEKAQSKPVRGKVIWLFTGAASLLAGVLLLNMLVRQPSPVVSNIAATSPAVIATPQAADANTEVSPVAPVAERVTAQPTSATAIAKIDSESSPTTGSEPIQSKQAEQSQAESAIVAQLPTEPTAAGVSSAGAAETALATVNFKFDSSKPHWQTEYALSELLAAAKRCEHRIKLVGHTCNLGSAAANQQLGLARANAVKKLLIADGIAADHIVTASEGMAKPLADNNTKAGQASNRRAELYCLDP